MAEVVLLDQRDAEAAHRGIARDTCARDTATDDQQIEELVARGVEAALHGGAGVKGNGAGTLGTDPSHKNN